MTKVALIHEHEEELYTRYNDFFIAYKTELWDGILREAHYHDVWEVLLVVRSDNKMYVNGKETPYSDNHLLIIPPQTVHSVAFVSDTEYKRYLINFKMPAFDVLTHVGAGAVADWLNEREAVNIRLDAKGMLRVTDLFAQLQRVYNKRPTPLTAGQLHMYFAILLIELYGKYKDAETAASPDTQAGSAARAKAYIDANFARDISLADIAKYANVSISQLTRVFREGMRTTVFAYLHYRRVCEAQKLLHYGLDTDEICRACGFNNIQHFYRTFKKITGETPGDYKKRLV